MQLDFQEIAQCTKGAFEVEPQGEKSLATGLTWDSREVKPGELYVALPGERVDGHDFVAAALAAGASGALVMRPLPEEAYEAARAAGAAVVRVPDTSRAVTDLAREWRGHLKGRVMGLTGSTGKTTTKNLVRDVLAASHSVVATQANQNNELGVPKTILSADEDTQAVVVEMGMRGRGQIEQLCEVVRPDWGLVTNVGECHIELLGSRENIARAKAELLCALPEGEGVAFLNGCDDYADFMREEAGLEERGVRTVCFDGSGRCGGAESDDGWRGGAAVWAEDVRLDDQGRPRFTLCARGFADADGVAGVGEAAAAVERQDCALELRGLHNVGNACSAAAVGRAFGMPLDVVARALAGALPESGRQEVLQAPGGFIVVNDAYNANPDSMRAALSTFCALKVPGRRVAVLGDMGELGDHADACHERIGSFAATLPLDRLVCVGELSRRIADAAERGGMPASQIVRVSSVEQALEDVDAWLRPGDAVLVKASHFMGLERVVEGLVG